MTSIFLIIVGVLLSFLLTKEGYKHHDNKKRKLKTKI